MGGTGGTVILSNGTDGRRTRGTGSVAANPAIIDLVGVNSNVWEGANKAPGIANTHVVLAQRDRRRHRQQRRRLHHRRADPDQQRRARGPRTPRTSVTPRSPRSRARTRRPARSPATSPPPRASSPRPTPRGGFAGFYLQTGGTGGATDATPGASDGIFVFAPGLDATTMPAVGDSVERARASSPSSTGSPRSAASPRRRAGRRHRHPGARPGHPAGHRAPATAADREAHEGELLDPSDAFTVTNTFTTNQFAEIGLATGNRPLISPTEVGAVGTPEYEAQIERQRRPRRRPRRRLEHQLPQQCQPGHAAAVALAEQPDPGGRGGHAAGRGGPRLPQQHLEVPAAAAGHGHGGEVATFTDTRTENAAPQPVGGDLKLGHVQRAQLLQHHRRGLREPRWHVHATSTTATATRWRSTAATRTVRAVPPRAAT